MSRFMTQADTSPLSEGAIDVFITPHPFSATRLHKKAQEGMTVEDIAKAQGAGLMPFMHVSLGGHDIARENWGKVRPKAGSVVSIRMAPMGGGGKDPLRTVLSIAIIAAGSALTGGLATALGGGMLAGRIAAAAVGLASRLALNALAPPARPRFSARKESPTLFIQGAQNHPQPFGRVPKVLGRHRFVPPYGALPYTETVGGEQYLRLLFVWGYGPLHITDLKIGETPLSDFEGVEVETRQGFADDEPLTLYSNSVLQNDLEVTLAQSAGYATRTTETEADEISVDVTFPRGLVAIGGGGNRLSATVRIEIQYAPAGTEDWSAPADDYKAIEATQAAFAAKPKTYKKKNAEYAVTRIDRVVIDMASGKISTLRGAEFRIGLDEGAAEPPALPPGKIALARVERRSDDGNVIPEARITDERSPSLTGVNFETSGDFAPSASEDPNRAEIAGGGLRFPGIAVTAKQTAALRENVTFKVEKGRYDVRLRRITEDAEENGNIFDECAWTALRTVRYAYPVNMQGLAMTALRIKATGQLSGVIDRFNGIVTSILPDWDGDEWAEQQTSNPASLFRHVLQGSANARPLEDTRLDLARLEAWHEACAAASREFNMVIDYDTSVREVLHSIAAAGRAAPALTDGKWAVVEDKPQSVPVQHFTPRNTWGFEGRKSFDEQPEALRARFINRNKGYMQDERLVYDDGFDASNTQKFETLELPGVTSAEQAWRDGRYHIATARLRPETYSFHCDIEHIVCTRGDLVRLSHDVPLFGLQAARVKSVAASGGGATGANAMVATGVYLLAYDGTNFILLNPAVSANFLLPRGTPLASAATTDIGAATSDYVEISGTTTITSLGSTATRNHVWVKFQGALTLAHNATSLILPTGANIATAAGDVAEFVRVSGANWQCLSYIPADGKPIAAIARADLPAGTVLQSISATYAANEALGSIPDDDTVPQITEGLEVATLAITPTSATSVIEIEFRGFAAAAGTILVIAALFRDSGADAIQVGCCTAGSANLPNPLVLVHRETAGSTSSRTYKIRAGTGSGSGRMNGTTSSRLFGGAASAVLIVREIKA